MVTAETAAALPLLVAVTVAMVWLTSVGVAQMKVTDAAREAARAVARGESESRAVELAERTAPGASVKVSVDGGMVVVEVGQAVRPLGGALDAIGGATVHSEAVALAEETEGDPGDGQ